MVEKTTAVRHSLQQLKTRREAHNDLEEQLDPVLRKAAAR